MVLGLSHPVDIDLQGLFGPRQVGVHVEVDVAATGDLGIDEFLVDPDGRPVTEFEGT